MRFGFFDQLPCSGAYSERQRYQDLMAQIELGDALGYFNQGGLMEHAMVRQSMTLFATEVLPHCR